jgi:isopentenyl diphosphate isomerase/L-lactate dehydrogenase-like FMN-dependent dehydrogenase
MTNGHARRAFLRYLAASPLLAAAAIEPLWRAAAADTDLPDDSEMGEIISSVKEALNVFDFHAVAREKLPPAHYGYMMSGTDSNETRNANRSGFKRYQLRVRRLVDVRKVDTSVELVGRRWDFPIGLSPTGSQKAFHPDGELAVARAARETNTVQILSTVTTCSVEDVNRELGQPAWFQLYATEDWNITQTLLRRAEQAGCPVVALTVDLQGDSNREMIRRYARKDTRDCNVCHPRGGTRFERKPMMAGLDFTNMGSTHGPQMDWDYARRLRDSTKMKLFIKGIVTAEDAKLCVDHGLDGIIVSTGAFPC